MVAVIRASQSDDLESLYEMSKLAGPGFTNLPSDRDALAAKLARSETAFAREDGPPGDDLYLLMMEDMPTGRIIGTAQIFAKIGERWPFYSYRISTISQASAELGRTFRAEMLTLTTDYDGCSEVGGLFLHPRARAGGLGMLLARSRYLFIRQHRARFADRVIAELRGMIDEAGASPFWDGLAGRFFGMSFQEADEFNAAKGNQFIADLMPKHPIYTALLSDAARLAMGRPHPNGRAAMRMLENEGFRNEGYVDIFDGGPTMVAATDRIRSVSEAADSSVTSVAGGDDGTPSILATGNLDRFRATLGLVAAHEDGIAIDPEAAAKLKAGIGAKVLHVER